MFCIGPRLPKYVDKVILGCCLKKAESFRVEARNPGMLVGNDLLDFALEGRLWQREFVTLALLDNLAHHPAHPLHGGSLARDSDVGHGRQLLAPYSRKRGRRPRDATKGGSTLSLSIDVDPLALSKPAQLLASPGRMRASPRWMLA